MGFLSITVSSFTEGDLQIDSSDSRRVTKSFSEH
jgi:hypothetical protein